MLEKFVRSAGFGMSIVANLVATIVIGGCESTPPLRAPDTGLASLGRPSAVDSPTANAAPDDSEISRMAEESARFLEARAQPKARPSAATAPLDLAAASDSKADTVDAPSSTIDPPVAVDSHPAVSGGGEKSAGTAQPLDGTTQKPGPTLAPRDALAAELGTAVAKAIRVLSVEPGHEATIGNLVAALEAIRPGFLTEVGNLDSPIVDAMGAANAAEIFNHRQDVPAGAAAIVAKEPEAAPPPPKPVLAIATATLCSKVTSFGRYDLLPGDAFASDQPIRALVYVEVENFADQEAGGDQRQVELSQRLALFKENETRDIWSTPEQTVREVARRTRRDFYLVQQIDLPRNLSLGSYTLKVTVTDKTNGAQAERNLPIRVVVGQRSATGE